jgi:hypothetical protein
LQQPEDIHTNNSVLDSHNLSLSKTAPQAGHLASPTPLVLSAAALYGAANGKAQQPKRRRYTIIQEGGRSARRLTGRKNRSCTGTEQLCSDWSLPLRIGWSYQDWSIAVSMKENTGAHPSDERTDKLTELLSPRDLATEFQRVLDEREEMRQQRGKQST